MSTTTPDDPTRRKSRKPSFAQWLIKQADRDDELGDIAYDAARDKSLPLSPGTYKSLVQHLKNNGACDEAFIALEYAFCEYIGFVSRL